MLLLVLLSTEPITESGTSDTTDRRPGEVLEVSKNTRTAGTGDHWGLRCLGSWRHVDGNVGLLVGTGAVSRQRAQVCGRVTVEECRPRSASGSDVEGVRSLRESASSVVESSRVAGGVCSKGTCQHEMGVLKFQSGSSPRESL